MGNEERTELEAFLTTDEVLGYLNTTPRTIYRLISTGELPPSASAASGDSAAAISMDGSIGSAQVRGRERTEPRNP